MLPVCFVLVLAPSNKGFPVTVSLQFSMISRTHCEIQNCPCADFVAESDEEVYVCRCGHRSGDHHLEKITFGIRAIY
jgi:hypothetical protein